MIVDQSSENGDKALVILQGLICYLREKNILSRCDIEELCERLDARSLIADDLACNERQVSAAAEEMRHLSEYCGKRFGGKRRRCL